MTEALRPRYRLANRRNSETFLFEIAGLKYTCTFSRFPDGALGEVFLSNTKPSSQSDTNARDSAVAASLALQFGCPLETLRGAVLRDPRGQASSPLGAALDWISNFDGGGA
jgi:ribonucleoside-diphosphate reductase alpha chain